MIEGLQRLEALAPQMAGANPQTRVPTLDIICAVVLYDYQQFRYGDQPWLPTTPALRDLAVALRQRDSVGATLPRAA